MRNSRRQVIRDGARLAIGAALWGVTGEEAIAAAAQEEPLAQAPEDPKSLAECLPFLDWDPLARGPLLIVAPERAKIPTAGQYYNVDTGRSRTQPPESGAVRAGRNGFRLTTISPRFRRKLVTAGGISAVVPDTMAVLRYKNLPDPDIWQGVRQESRPQFLLATLSPVQWGRLMSEEGLGIGDLKRDQQTLFAGLFPEKMKIYRRDPSRPSVAYNSDEVSLTGMTASSFRLRLYQDLQWEYQFRDPKQGTLTMGDGGWEGTSGPSYSVSFPPDETAYQAFESTDGEMYGGGAPSAFGVTLVEALPNRAKPSDLNYDAATWNAAVAPVGAKTVGELVARVREATGVEVYTDPRYGGLPVYLRVTPERSLRAGDLLKALALSVTGTFRRVSSSADACLVLTDDRVGLGTRVAAIGNWMGAAQQQLQDVRKQFADGATGVDAWEKTPWALKGDMAPSDDLRQKMTAINQKPYVADEKPGERLIPMSDLPPGVQARVQAQQKQWQERMADGNSFHRPIREDGVRLRPKLKLALIVPGIGAIPYSQGDLMEGDRGANQANSADMPWHMSGVTPPDMAASLPTRLEARWFTKRILTVAVESADDARRAAVLAQNRHFSGLLLPIGARPAKEVAEWVAAAREAAPGMAVWVKASLLRHSIAGDATAGDATAGDDNRFDRNVWGETYAASLRRPIYATNGYYGPRRRPSGGETVGSGDYLAVTDKNALGLVRSRLAALTTELTGVAGIVLTDTTPPGYTGQNNGGGDGSGADRELGYTPASRLAFLRETGADPLDLSPFGDLQNTGWVSGMDRRQTRVHLPFFPDLGPNVRNWTINGKGATTIGAKDLYPRWYDFRAKQLTAAIKELHDMIRSEKPGVELWAYNSGTWGAAMSKWEPPTPRPVSPAKQSPVAVVTAKPVAAAAAAPDVWWMPLTYNPNTPPGVAPMKNGERFARQIARSMEWMRKPATPQVKAAASNGKYALLLDLTAVPLADAEELFSQIVIEPSPVTAGK